LLAAAAEADISLSQAAISSIGKSTGANTDFPQTESPPAPVAHAQVSLHNAHPSLNHAHSSVNDSALSPNIDTVEIGKSNINNSEVSEKMKKDTTSAPLYLIETAEAQGENVREVAEGKGEKPGDATETKRENLDEVCISNEAFTPIEQTHSKSRSARSTIRPSSTPLLSSSSKAEEKTIPRLRSRK
jgi:hypothetical protein